MSASVLCKVLMPSGGEEVVDPKGVQARLAKMLREASGATVGKRLVLIKGPAGMGKSTHARAALSGYSVTELDPTEPPEVIRRVVRNMTTPIGETRPPALLVDGLEAFFGEEGGDRCKLSLIHI